MPESETVVNVLGALAQVRHGVKFTWVRGHAGNLENERCDRLVMAYETNQT
jgi:ribonuclease HI